jgi:transposase InsO family protein
LKAESFNARLRDELLNGEIFETLLEAKVFIERRCVHYNTVRPHSALGGRPPAPEAIFQRKDFTKGKLKPMLT